MMAGEELTLDDMVGFPLLLHNRLYMLWTGHWVGAVPGPTPIRVKIARALGAGATWLVLIYVAAACVNGMLHGSGLTEISLNLILISTTTSAIHKYCVFTEQEQGLGRLGRWVKRVNDYRKANNIPDTTTDRVLKKSLKAFYYSGNIAPVVLAIKMLLTGNTYNIMLPGIEDPHPVLVMGLIVYSFNAMAYEVIVDASILMNSLFTFRGELMRIVDEWKSMTFVHDNPERYSEELKANVRNHVELLVIFQDLKKYNNSMFGYQVFAAVFTTCALIYGMAKGTNILGEAIVQVLPTSTASILEFAMLCWTGEEIRHGFQQVHRNIYMTNWYEAPLRDKKSITIVLEFSKNPITLTGFSVFTATLNTFVEVMRQSFSMYTLLKAVL